MTLRGTTLKIMAFLVVAVMLVVMTMPAFGAHKSRGNQGDANCKGGESSETQYCKPLRSKPPKG